MSGLLGEVDRATERANRLEAENRRLQKDALVVKLSTAREGLEYARAQFVDEDGGPAPEDYTRAIVERLDTAISESDPEA